MHAYVEQLHMVRIGIRGDGYTYSDDARWKLPCAAHEGT